MHVRGRLCAQPTLYIFSLTYSRRGYEVRKVDIRSTVIIKNIFLKYDIKNNIFKNIVLKIIFSNLKHLGFHFVFNSQFKCKNKIMYNNEVMGLKHDFSIKQYMTSVYIYFFAIITTTHN